MAAVAAAVGSAAVAIASSGTPVQQQRLVVNEKVVENGATYIEGAYSYLVVKRAADGAVVFKRRYSRRMHLDRAFALGRYRLVSYVRSCAGTCDHLDDPSGRCSAPFTLRQSAAVRAVIRTEVGERCRIHFR